MTGHGDTGSLDLAVGDQFRLQRHESVVAERNLILARGVAPNPAALSLAELLSFRTEHDRYNRAPRPRWRRNNCPASSLVSRPNSSPLKTHTLTPMVPIAVNDSAKP